MDFFISYTHVDRRWAEWVAWELHKAGFGVFVQAWDISPGHDFVHQMQVGLDRAKRVLALLSPAYLELSASGEAEWRSAFARDPSGEARALIPVRVAECKPQGLLATRVYVDLVGRGEQEAREALLSGVTERLGPPESAPAFPGGGGHGEEPVDQPRFPGALPEVFGVPFAPNRYFTGRGADLDRLGAALGAGEAVHRVALVGGAGVGKTALAVEYAYAQASRFDLVGWVRADDLPTLAAGLAGLATTPLARRELDATVTATVEEQVQATRGWLERRGRWLLVVDNIEDPILVRDMLPRSGTGQVLLTARADVGWAEVASVVDLDVLDSKSAADFLQARSGQVDQDAARTLAADLGRLPLALEQAAGYIAETGGLTLARYRDLFRNRSLQLLSRGRPSNRTDAVATTWSLSLGRLRKDTPTAVALLNLCAFLAPEDIPVTLLAAYADALPDEVSSVFADPLTLADSVGALRKYGLVKATDDAISVHRLLQTVVRGHGGEEASRWADSAVEVLAAAFPEDPARDVHTWPTCQRLVPHVVAVTDISPDGGVAISALAGAKAVDLLNGAATYLQARALYGDARALFERALAYAEAALGPEDANVGALEGNLGSVLRDLGDLGGAREHLERGLAIRETTLGPGHLSLATLRNNMAVVLQGLGDLVGAREQLEWALAIGEAALGPDHPEVGVWRNNLGAVLRGLGDLSGAREQYERALAISEVALGPDHPDVGTRRSNLGGLLSAQGDWAGAREQYERALAISEAALGPDHPDVGRRRGNLALVLHSMGDLARAREQLERALDISEAALGPRHPDVGIKRSNLGGLLRAQGDLAGAREQYERALAITEAALGPDHPNVGTIRDNLAVVRKELSPP